VSGTGCAGVRGHARSHRNRVIVESCILAVDLRPLRLRQHQIQPRLAIPEHGIESHQEDPHAGHDSDLGKPGFKPPPLK